MALILVIVQLNQSALAENRSSPCSTALFDLSPASALDHRQRHLTHLFADYIYAQDQQTSTLLGNVMVLRSEDQTFADRLIYHYENEQIDLLGNLRFENNDAQIQAHSGTLYNTSESGVFYDADFFILEQNGRGYAEKITRDEDNITTLDNTTYTTCPAGQTDWQFRAKQIRLDHDQGVGYAKQTSLRFKNVPIFYFPAMSFPINDQRRSGFLIPDFGSGDKRGTEIDIPYYWNIAPQADATIAINHMSKRGTQIRSEWRYLSTWNMNQLQTEYLDDSLFGESRWLYKLDHHGQPWQNWSTNIRASEISDADYFHDLGYRLSDRQGQLGDVNVPFLSREANLFGSFEHWSLLTLFLDYQTIDTNLAPSDQPYAYLPKLALTGVYYNLPGGFDYELQADIAALHHPTKVTGNRFDIYPRISRPFGSAAWFLTPSAGIRHTQYRLTPQALGDPSSVSRTLPVFSLDGGLIFERTIGGQGDYVQTLEPRLFYLNIPFREQSLIPVFDSAELDFSFAQLFRENRFTGRDRVNDANQYALALSTRILKNDTGEELFKASIGQIVYLEDRRVGLASTPGVIDNRAQSDIVSEIITRLGKQWSLKFNLEWNPENHKIEQGTTRLRYFDGSDRIFNFGYRFRRSILEQTELSMRWPLSDRWSSVAKSVYSVVDKQHVESFAGLEYENCCYVFRVIGRRYLNHDEFNNDIYLQLSFKGFADLGDDTGLFLERNIPGFSEQLY